MMSSMKLFKRRTNQPPQNTNPSSVLLNENGVAQQTTSQQNQAMIIDGNQHNFMQEVLESSKEIPVMVDFWANWCAPCKQLTPILEKITQSARGRIKLVKLDIDANTALVQQLMQIGLPIQSIPLVAAFWKGQIIDMFQGSQPESAVQQFVDHILKAAGSAMPSADFIEEGQQALNEGQADKAVALFSQALENEPERPEIWGGLIRAVLAHTGPEDAQNVLNEVPKDLLEHSEITGAQAAIDLAKEGAKAQSEADQLMDKIKADPNDFQARYDLATALNASGKKREAADELLKIIQSDRQWNDEGAKKQLLRFFEAWGVDDPITLEARRRLSSLLFS